MKPVIFDLGMNKNGLVKNIDKVLVRKEIKTTYLNYCEDEDVRGKYVIPVLKYKLFDEYKDMYYGFSIREGGVSKEHLYSLNLSFSRGDEEENVRINHERFAKAVGYDTNTLVFSNQLHNDNIKIVSKTDAGKGYCVKSDIVDADGLVTNERGVTLITFFADCVPVFFYDDTNQVVGLAHSGWKGTAKQIATKMINTMVNEYGSMADKIKCAIGPSICKQCYEVSKDVISCFEKVYSKEQMKELAQKKDNGKYLLDLQLAVKYNLIKAGVMEENIAMPDLCTSCNKNYLFSHRASNGQRGNLAAVIGLK